MPVSQFMYSAIFTLCFILLAACSSSEEVGDFESVIGSRYVFSPSGNGTFPERSSYVFEFFTNSYTVEAGGFTGGTYTAIINSNEAIISAFDGQYGQVTWRLNRNNGTYTLESSLHGSQSGSYGLAGPGGGGSGIGQDNTPEANS